MAARGIPGAVIFGNNHPSYVESLQALIRHGWNKSRAAAELGLSRVGLRNKLERYGLEKK